MNTLVVEPIDQVITRFHRPSQPRAGDRSARKWWVCPFHQDVNPSLCVETGSRRFKCFGCGASGDAIDFVRRLHTSMSFREARAAIGGGGPAPRPSPRPATPRPRKPEVPRPPHWQDFVRNQVKRAEVLLWSSRGADARHYLHGRGLNDATIRAAHLGFEEKDYHLSGIFPRESIFIPCGIVIPWFEGPDIRLVNIRRPVEEPRYWALRGGRRGGVYPSRQAITAGLPLILAEGELDTLLLAQELAGLASVVTLGTAGDRPAPAVLNAMLGASRWLVAYDADAAGEKSADHWLARSRRCRRIRPPTGKDWTESFQVGIDLRSWWEQALAGGMPTGTAPLVRGEGRAAEADPTRRPASCARASHDQVAELLEAFEQRAAVLEFEGGLDRQEAERQASESVFGFFDLPDWIKAR